MPPPPSYPPFLPDLCAQICRTITPIFIPTPLSWPLSLWSAEPSKLFRFFNSLSDILLIDYIWSSNDMWCREQHKLFGEFYWFFLSTWLSDVETRITLLSRVSEQWSCLKTIAGLTSTHVFQIEHKIKWRKNL